MRCTNPLCGWTGFNTQPPEGGWERDLWKPIVPVPVSTHSRLKAAGRLVFFTSQHSHRFNTQPPEGGWRQSNAGRFPQSCFNTQPPEGGWSERDRSGDLSVVSTHSRLKAAGRIRRNIRSRRLSFNTQPPEGGWSLRNTAP